MRIVVLGGGVIGVTTAYYLARDGHEVTVLDRQPQAASETSFANAGLVVPGHAYTWAPKWESSGRCRCGAGSSLPNRDYAKLVLQTHRTR